MAQWDGPVDSAANNILLKNRYVQIEATSAMYDMYNMDFERAARQYEYLKKQYGWHPLPYFLHGLNYWWQMLPYVDDDRWDEPFVAYMDTAQVLAERIYNEVSQIEGAFFLAAAHAFKGRLYSERRDWTKAAFEGRKALKYLEECKGHEDFSPELLFGDGLFNYYAVWVPENYPILKPVMAFFPEGDKDKGMDQLEETARNAFYTRTEAQYFLMRILYFEKGDIAGAYQMAKYLHDTYPNNAYFHRFYARLLYQTGRYTEAIEESKLIIERIDLQEPGYEYHSGRYASFFLGHIYEIKGNKIEAEKYYRYAKEYGELCEATDKGYYIFSVLHLGILAEEDERYEEAEEYYRIVKKNTKRKNRSNERAREGLKSIRNET
jgi:tetratricopeptide (TPR) repeat protein